MITPDTGHPLHKAWPWRRGQSLSTVVGAAAGMDCPQPCFIPAGFRHLIQLRDQHGGRCFWVKELWFLAGCRALRGIGCQQPIRGLTRLGAQRGWSVLPGGIPKELEQAHKHSHPAMDDSSQSSWSDSGTSQQHSNTPAVDLMLVGDRSKEGSHMETFVMLFGMCRRWTKYSL